MNLREFSHVNWERAEQWHEGAEPWSRADWLTAALGELGEAANLAKKMKRLQDDLPGNRPEDSDFDDLAERMAEEIADTVIYLDLLCSSMGYNLSAQMVEKFNRKSEEAGFPHKVSA